MIRLKVNNKKKQLSENKPVEAIEAFDLICNDFIDKLIITIQTLFKNKKVKILKNNVKVKSFF